MAEPHRLYLVRHAIAEARGADWPDDAKRPLTAKGIRRFERVVAGFEAMGESVDVIFTSPLVRARQTAEILAEGLSSLPPRRVLVELSPGGTPPRTVRALSRVPADARGVAVVGHEPDLGAVAAWCLGLRVPPEFRKGGICRIDVTDWPPDRGGRLVWFATPKMIRS